MDFSETWMDDGSWLNIAPFTFCVELDNETFFSPLSLTLQSWLFFYIFVNFMNGS